ncbi:hypothetical protein BT96DRAFT_923914 [Gymnopus androsaceus JB14]|uniref:DUF4203 domain-containing protein n=1 Tax=Gymnopus androsaceus JB14 TaxID=1447944 RepID=A0A6A4H7C2_9AGAR|nr:hypothetical protein BT96DRAFT_923914 [Gymnopus androsaceus JB14]
MPPYKQPPLPCIGNVSSTHHISSPTHPLLLISLVLTFAGAFLTLDRTRFKPRYDALPVPGTFGNGTGKQSGTIIRELIVFEGGVGGMMLGYAFGLHLSTFLALIIPTSSSSSLSSSAFIAVWILSSISTAILGGRYILVALVLAGLSGGALFALSVCVIIHPELSTRVILVSVCMSLLTLAIILATLIPPLHRFKHPLLRFAASSTGAFGPSSALSWASVWSHLALAASTAWGTNAEKGYSALFCLLPIAGAAADWGLWRKWGTNPDEKWDSYLAEYAANLPNDTKRAGTFQPFASVWDKMFGHAEAVSVPSSGKHDVLFPLADIEMAPDLDPPTKLGKNDKGFSPTTTAYSDPEPLPLYTYASTPGVLKKGRRPSKKASIGGAFRKKEVVKFRPLDEVSSGSDSDEEDGRMRRQEQRPWLRTMSSATSSTPTLVDSSGLKSQTKSNNSNSGSLREDEELDYEKEVGRLKAAIKRRVSGTASPGLSDEAGTPPDYSDFEEEDIFEQKDGEKEKEWSPKFLRRQSHRSSASNPKPNPTPNDPTRSPNPTGAISPLTSPFLAPLPLAPVPATPSLLHALDRVEKARRDAFTAGSAAAGAGAGAESQKIIGDEKDATEAGGRGQRWEEFWREVKAVKDKDKDREGRR